MARWKDARPYRVILTGSRPEPSGPAGPPNVARALPGPFATASRAWDGVEAARFVPASGEISVPPLANHLVVLHLGRPVKLAQRADGGRGRERLVVRGDSAVVPAGAATEWRWGEEGAESLHLYLGPALVREAAEGAGLDPDAVEIVGGLGPRDPQIERFGLSFLPDLEAGDLPGGGLYAEALARALAVHLLREHSTLGRGALAAAARGPRGGLPKRALKRATDYVGDNLAGDIALEDLARAANASPSHFSRLFKESTGLSPHRYVIERRVERARELLTRTDVPLHEVAAAAGFAHQSHMGRHLKRLLGVTPAGLRRR